MIKESFKTIELNLMFKNGQSNPPKANDEKSQYQQTPDSSRRKRAIPRVIINMENADVLFSEDC
ncbi:9293_t:CDS:2 [Funneliformis geosporum]|uniref:9293_t:CDS:1 n=1 Tax=Funneliformis geosporum TaxID=1117311 RepID=A0A9W4TAV6_9GLOM|nr:9293_t:CDS:2 [Funneliformis geosporum]